MNQRKDLYRITLPTRGTGQRRLARAVEPWLETALGLDQLNDLYSGCTQDSPHYKIFLHRILDWVRIRWKVGAEELSRIPKTGPLVVVANHPFGALEGIVLAAILSEVRDDVKVMANFLLGRITELRDLFIFVDPFEKVSSTTANVAPLRQSIRHLKNGGVLAVFPAGEVASFDLKKREILDPPWNTTVARLIHHTRAPVLPVFFDGRNSILFQALGIVHPRLRTGLLAREFFNQRGTRVKTLIGSAIPFKRLEDFDDAHLTAYLRQRTYLLQHRRTKQINAASPLDSMQPIIPPVAADLLAADVEKLNQQILVDAEDCQVFHARANQIPNVMRELGRLREITFRATGEGTGLACDVDQFDDDYVHLFVWQKKRREIVGAYRLGPTDEILQRSGKAGLYTSTLFKCKSALLRHITPALELGRSFVRGEYQKSFSPLMLLWKGIGQYIVNNPRYRYLFGPVSISNSYQSVSKQLMVRFLQDHHCPQELVDLAQARNPFKLARIAGWDRSAFRMIRDSEDVSDLISDLEPQNRGIPVLLRQYLKLGAKLLAFNVDPGFSDCVDALMVCDLTRTDVRMIDRYMGKDGRERFLQYHTDRTLAAKRIDAVMA